MGRPGRVGAQVTDLDVCLVEELPPGTVKIVIAGLLAIGVYNCGGEYFALEDRCSHDDGPLCEGDWDNETCVAVCPRHGSNIDIRTGRALTLPAVLPVQTFPVRVADGIIKVDIP
jgi:3-phenylpropionate/trans-cinnamate dioxygenase ferredoxin component